MKRFDRVFSILILLQAKKKINARTIADRYGVSDRTVYRDIRTLKLAGIPIIGDPGIGYSILDNYRIPPMMFTDEEISALLTGEKIIGKMTDQGTQAHYSDAMVKIKAILRHTEKASLAALEEAISISDSNRREHKNYLQDLFKSIAAKKVIAIEYQKADKSVSQRELEPIGCYHQSRYWYLVAYCHFRKDYRTFKVNRILCLKVLDRHFEKSHISLQSYIDRQDEEWKNNRVFHAIEVSFTQAYVEYAEMRKYYFGFVEQFQDDDAIHMKFLYSSIEVMARWLLQFGDQARVIAPEELKDRVKSLATQLYEHHRK